MAAPQDFDDTLPRTIPGILDRAAERFGAAEALVDGELRLSWIEMVEEIDRAAAALFATGVEPGDRVAIWAHNIAEWVFAAEGAHRCRAVVVPLNTRFKGDEAAYILRTAGARILFTVTDFLDTNYVDLIHNAGDVSTLEEIVVLRGPEAPDTTS